MGTVHHDTKGYARLKAFLDSFQPDLILLELSPYAWMFRKRFQASFQRRLEANLARAVAVSGLDPRQAGKHARVTAIRRQIALPFEYRAASAHASRSGAKIFLVDYSGFSRKWIESWPEMISPENLRGLLSLPSTRGSAERVYRTAERCIVANEPPVPGIAVSGGDLGLWQERECRMARKIIAVLYARRPVRPLYLGGWWHLTRDSRITTLRDLLGVDPSRCLLLDRGSSGA
jgi:hypothetical protein